MSSLTPAADRPVDRTPGIAGFELVGPNWFASIMGTGIVAVAAVQLPFDVPGIEVFATAVWLLAATVLVVVSYATLMHWLRHPDVARSHLDHPVMAHFYGAPAMALMTVGVGAVLVGHRVIGMSAALAVDWVLWTAGTLLGLGTAVVVPLRAITRHDTAADSAFGGWLMPVVPPMVSAATGAVLIPHLPTAEARQTMLLFCMMFFGLSLMVSIVMITWIWQRLVHHGIGAAAAVPTLWIVLGPLGQSITAAHNLGNLGPDVLAEPFGAVLQGMGLVYGVPMWGFAMLWFALAVSITVRTVRTGMPFGLPWWSFTFPVGTVVTGTCGLADLTGDPVLTAASGVLFVFLVTMWATVAVRTLLAVRARAI